MVFICKQLAVGQVAVGWLNPVARYNTRQSNTYACCTVQPSWAWPIGELLAEILRKVIAVLGKQIVCRSEEMF
ncbi:hypothetical protein OOU_Y34scaffold00979g43 [Pyricularia oryzae Y34]|uniref:Uncharacterized protein n=2 Tax=Pyricularia oryzae TaxID=318829 RepID=A0AA97PG15_PYRO3|nr:hypothetical protein OOU_Y34scaffold00979g43 [Pyricularia oryzae Y34]